MSSFDLNVATRDTTGKEEAGRMRRLGRVPAVAYGLNIAPVTLSLNAKELRDLLAHGHGRGLLNLKIEGQPSVSAIIKSVHRHPATHAAYSVDFQRVSLSEKITASVPIVLEGEPVGVKVDGGILVQALMHIEVSALPQDLPENITVDVSELVYDGAPIHVREIAVPDKIEFVTDGETPVAVVNPPDVEPIVEATMTAEQIAESEAADVNPMVNSEQGKEDKTTGDKSDTGEKPGKN